MAATLNPFTISDCKQSFHRLVGPIRKRRRPLSIMSMSSSSSISSSGLSSSLKIVDSHLHIWASPKEVSEGFAYSFGHEPTLQGDLDFLLECMEDAGVDGALIVQPINHMFDHSLVTRCRWLTCWGYTRGRVLGFGCPCSALKKHPTKFVGCCLANPAPDGGGIPQLEHLVLEEGYRAVRFNPYLWPTGQKMTNEMGKLLFQKAGELGVPVGIMCMKGLDLHLSEIEKLCSEFPSTIILDHLAFCKLPTTDAERDTLTGLLSLSQFPQVYVKFSALFRISRKLFPYEDTSFLLSEAIARYGVDRIMWGSDFPFVVPECGYNGAKQSVLDISKLLSLTEEDREWIMGKTVQKLFKNAWLG